MKELKRIPDTYSKDLIKDFNTYFETNNEFLKGNNFNINVEIWYSTYKELKRIFKNYYYINNDNFDLETPEDVKYGGGYCLLNHKYKDKYVKDVYEICIKSAYPQKINKLFLEGMESNDEYFPYIFNLVYQHIGIQKKPSIINLFINFTYGVLIMNKEKYDNIGFDLPRVDRDLKKHVALYYKSIMESIDKKMYYYIDTDGIFLKKDNIDKVSKIFDDNNIEYFVEEPYNYLFIGRKKFVKLKNNEIKKIKGLRLDKLYDKYEKVDGVLIEKYE